MKTLGMLGGTGPESTVEYYRRLIAAYQKRDPQGRAPSLIINSIDNKKLIAAFTANQLDVAADYLVAELDRLAAAGADFALMSANTPHIVFDQVQQRVRIPLLSIVDATADAAVAAGVQKPALFGTRFTMQAALFPECFARRGMALVVPNDGEQQFIHAKYMGELFVGTILDETRAALTEIVEAMKARDAIDALILGGTELSLIFREPTVAGLPVLDTTQIHVDAAVERMLRD
ncbi:MAG: aspartate/glutamate racemase family protein [Chthoniobacterales bacterium]